MRHWTYNSHFNVNNMAMWQDVRYMLVTSIFSSHALMEKRNNLENNQFLVHHDNVLAITTTKWLQLYHELQFLAPYYYFQRWRNCSKDTHTHQMRSTPKQTRMLDVKTSINLISPRPHIASILVINAKTFHVLCCQLWHTLWFYFRFHFDGITMTIIRRLFAKNIQWDRLR